MKIGIVGTRRRNSEKDFKAVVKALDKLRGARGGTKTWLVSGGCPKGADRFAEALAKKHGYTITIFYPNWEILGQSAPFVRNTDIAKECDVLIACVAPDREGGTEDTIRKAKKFGKEIIIVT